MKNKTNRLAMWALGCLSIFVLTACGGGANSSGRENQIDDSPPETALLRDQLGECYTKEDSRASVGTLTVNGYTLTETQARNVRWIARCVAPFFPGTAAEKATIAANTAWWSLREGILDLEGYRAARYSNCHENGRDRGRSNQPLYSCPTNIWQVGIAAAQVMNYSDKQVAQVANLTFGKLDSRINDEAILGWSASLAGFPEGDPLHKAIVKTQGRVRRSWMLRNPVIGFMLVEKQEVIRECLVQKKRWCYGSGYPSAKKFARNEAALRQSIADLKRIFLAHR